VCAVLPHFGNGFLVRGIFLICDSGFGGQLCRNR
jgi:hypothetical protein